MSAREEVELLSLSELLQEELSQQEQAEKIWGPGAVYNRVAREMARRLNALDALHVMAVDPVGTRYCAACCDRQSEEGPLTPPWPCVSRQILDSIARKAQEPETPEER